MDSEVSTSSLEDFEPYLPFCPSPADVESCTQQLIKNKDIMTQDKNGRLTLHVLQNPDNDMKEKEHFKGLEHLGIALEKCKFSSKTLNYRYIDTGEQTIHSDIEESTNKIDGSIVPVCITKDDLQGRTEHHTTNIAVVCKWKMDSNPTNELDNNINVFSANVQIMNDDIRRMYGYGLTIEGKYLRVWYLSRSFTLVTHKLDYIEEPQKLIKVLISFMFATEKEIGYDPTITRHSPNIHTYEIGGRFFRTEYMISRYRSNHITGRMARIWSAEEVDSKAKDARVIEGKDKCVVKDVWLEDTAKTEGEIQSAIFDDIRRFWKKRPGEKSDLDPIYVRHDKLVKSGDFTDYFLGHDVDQRGETTKAYNKEKFKVELGLFLEPVERSTSPTPSRPSQPTDTRRLTVGNTKGTRSVSRQRVYDREFASRRQYRVVFKEKCHATVGQLATLGRVVDILQQTLIPLQLLFCAGWVHCDISSGNILAYRKPDGSLIAKLSDLEYARKFPREDGKVGVDPKTGTPYFMAIEILDRMSLAVTITGRTPVVIPGQPSTTIKQAHQLPVIHNFAHEMESVWWILFWTITARVEHQESREYAKQIFDNCMVASFARRCALLMPIQAQLEDVLEEELRAFANEMESLRYHLLFCYRERFVTETALHDPSSYVDIYENFQKVFDYYAQNNEPRTWAGEMLRHSNDSLLPPPATTVTAPETPPDMGASQGSLEPPGRGHRLEHSAKRSRSSSDVAQSPTPPELILATNPSKRSKTDK